jgi:hypothetical protein
MAADPGSGRGRGCFTALDLALGLKAPSQWTRTTEFVVGATLFVGIPTTVAVSLIRAAIARTRQRVVR